MNISGYRDLLFLPDIEHIYMKKREKVKSCFRKRQHLKNAPMLAVENVPKVGGKIHQNQLVGLGSSQLVLVAHQSVLVAHDCNSAIGGQGHSGCTWTVSHGSSSELWISIRIKLNYVEPLSKMGLVKLPHLSVRGSKMPQINDCGVWAGQCQWCRRKFESRRGRTGVLTIVLTLAGMTPLWLSYMSFSGTKFTALRKVPKTRGDGGKDKNA